MSTTGAWLAAPIRGYRRWISPALPPTCRFEPSCSEYAVQALTSRGPLLGSALTVWRLLRCAPWSAGGWDPVPPRRGTAKRLERRGDTHDEAARARRTLRVARRTPGMSRPAGPAFPGTSRSLRREPSVVS